jgi:ABC-type enterochelin transport system permease subunit
MRRVKGAHIGENIAEAIILTILAGELFVVNCALISRPLIAEEQDV